ncbi:MAG: hypothetical protein IPL46_12745 [Saprospiraceae bacterium]|nr:hypothetical protein [Saprospiraceae bacterium]
MKKSSANSAISARGNKMDVRSRKTEAGSQKSDARCPMREPGAGRK